MNTNQVQNQVKQGRKYEGTPPPPSIATHTHTHTRTPNKKGGTGKVGEEKKTEWVIEFKRNGGRKEVRKETGNVMNKNKENYLWHP